MNYIKKKICALEGTSVEMFSYYSHPSSYAVIDTFWFTDTDGQFDLTNLFSKPKYDGRLEYVNLTNQNRHKLIIKNVTRNDNAEYKFRIITDKSDGKYHGIPGVTLHTTGK